MTQIFVDSCTKYAPISNFDLDVGVLVVYFEMSENI